MQILSDLHRVLTDGKSSKRSSVALRDMEVVRRTRSIKFFFLASTFQEGVALEKDFFHGYNLTILLFWSSSRAPTQ